MSILKVAMPCFKCGKTLVNLCDGHHQPVDGLDFHTYGHYGSKAFDPMDDTSLHISVCDECLVENSNSVLHCEPVRIVEKKFKYSKWKPPTDGTPDTD